ncbi:MAG TPA: hypothetical protein VGB81_03550 [Devosia sp.]
MSEPHLHRPADLGTVHYFQRSHSGPMEVVNDPTMTTQQKREILADWAQTVVQFATTRRYAASTAVSSLRSMLS